MAARNLLAEPRAPRNEEAWERMKAKLSEEDQTFEAAAAAMAASSSEPEEGSGPNWRPEEEFDLQVTLEVINSRNALSSTGSDGLRFLHLQSIVRTGANNSELALKPSGT